MYKGWAIKLALAPQPVMIYCASPLTAAMIITVAGVSVLVALYFVFILALYRRILTHFDEFTGLRFTAAGMPPAARCIRNLPMNLPITFGMKGSN
jgi:hypothetical protein